MDRIYKKVRGKDCGILDCDCRSFFKFSSRRLFLYLDNKYGGCREGSFWLRGTNQFYPRSVQSHTRFPDGWREGIEIRPMGKDNDYFYATQKASSIGRGIALFFIFFGLFSIFTGGPGGLWLMFIGWFLYSAAQASYQQATLQETLSGIKVKDIMVREMQTIDPSISLDKAVNEYFLRYGYGGFPVIDDGKFLGIITLKELKNVPRENWGKVKVSAVFVTHDKKWEISPDVDVMKALELMIKEDKGRIAVTEKDKIIGLITRNGIAQYVQIRGK
jgi:CBS domain-containing protein